MIKKIVHIIPELRKGGAERLVLDTCIELSKRKELEVVLIVFRENNAYTYLSEKINVKVIPATVQPSLSGKTKVAVNELQSFIDSVQPDIIHSHLFEAEIVLSQVNCGKAKRIVHFHDNMPQFRPFGFTGSLKKNITDRFERNMVLKSYDLQQTIFIAISRNTEVYMKNVLPKEARIVYLTNAIDLERFARPENTSRDPNNICMIGSFVPKKGQDLAIQTIHTLKQRGHNFTLHLLGDGPLRNKLETLTSNLDMKNNVCFHGNVDHPEEYLWRSGIYLHTAKYEPLGLVLLEAMAAETPIVCTDGGGNRDIIENGQNGFLIEERSPDLLADQIMELTSNKELTDQLTTSAKSYVQQYGIGKYTEELMMIYAS